MLDPVEDLFHRARDYASLRIAARVLEALHGVGLARSSLSIGQNRGIVPLKDGADGMLGRAFINILLGRIHVIDVVEAVSVPHRQVWVHFDVLRLLSIVNLSSKVLHAGYGSIVVADLHNGKEEVALFLALQGWAQSDHNFEILIIRGSLARLEGVGADISPAGIGAATIRQVRVLGGLIAAI